MKQVQGRPTGLAIQQCKDLCAEMRIDIIELMDFNGLLTYRYHLVAKVEYCRPLT